MSLFMLISATQTYACDACGGITMNQNDTDFSFTNKVSLSASLNRYRINNKDDQSTYDQYNFFSNQLSGTYVPKDKMQLGLMIPINGIVILSDDKMHNWGLGDLVFTSYFNVLEKTNEEKSVKHALNSGIGMIFPTGKKALVVNSGNENLNMQLSAESWAWFGKLDYLIQIKKWSIAQTNTVNLYAKNKRNYRFGNIYNHGLKVQLQIPLSSSEMSIHPYITTSFEHASNNLSNGYLRKFTGYQLVNVSPGVICSIKGNSFSLAYSQVLWQKQNNDLIKKQNGLVLSYAYKFK